MNNFGKLAGPLAGQRGMALISALLLLLVVSLLAVGLSMDSSMDVRLAGYQRFMARAFGFAESGLMASGDILESNAYDAGWEDDDVDFNFPHLSGEYVGTLHILADRGDFYLDENAAENTTMEMRGDINADVMTQKVVSKLAKGGALQVAAGYAGIGKGLGGGGAHVIYNVESETDFDNARAEVAMYFRMVTK